MNSVKKPVLGAEVWAGMQEPPKVPLLELKFYRKLEMYVNNNTKNINVFYKDKRAMKPQRKKSLSSER